MSFELGELIIGDSEITIGEFLDELKTDENSRWTRNNMPDTLTLRRMIILADWASVEPKKWKAYRLRYCYNMDTEEIAAAMGVSQRSVQKYLQPVNLDRIEQIINK